MREIFVAKFFKIIFHMLSHWQISVCIKTSFKNQEFFAMGMFTKNSCKLSHQQKFFLVSSMFAKKWTFILFLKVHKQTKTLKFFPKHMSMGPKATTNFSFRPSFKKKFFTEHSACGKKPTTTRIGGKLIPESGTN